MALFRTTSFQRYKKKLIVIIGKVIKRAKRSALTLHIELNRRKDKHSEKLNLMQNCQNREGMCERAVLFLECKAPKNKLYFTVYIKATCKAP